MEYASPFWWKSLFLGLTIFFAVFLFCVTAENLIENFLRDVSHGLPFDAPDVTSFLFGTFMIGIVVVAIGILPALILFSIYAFRGVPSLLECLLAGIAAGIIFAKWQADFSDIYFTKSDALLFGSMGLAPGLATWLFWRRLPPLDTA